MELKESQQQLNSIKELTDIDERNEQVITSERIRKTPFTWVYDSSKGTMYLMAGEARICKYENVTRFEGIERVNEYIAKITWEKVATLCLAIVELVKQQENND